MNRYLALQKQVFDISKVTVVGNPTITSDGVASGFDTSSQVAGFLTFTATKSIKYKIRITTATDITTYQYMMRFYNNVNGTYATHAISLQNGVFKWMFKDGGIVDIGAVSPNTQYDLTLFIDGVNNIGRCYINGVEQSKTYSSPVLMAGNNSAIGFGNMGSAWGNNGQNATALDRPFFGSVDLKYCSVEVDNQLVYSPTKPTYLLERRKPTVWNKGQFTVIGSPVISDDGVASGFSRNSFIKIPHKYTVNDNIKFSFKINGGTSGAPFIGFIDSTAASLFYFNKLSATRIKTVFRNTSFQNLFEREFDVPAQEAVISCNITRSSLSLFLNGIEITSVNNDFSSFIDGFNNLYSLCIGSNQTGGEPFSGSIDLKSYKIYTDSTLVFDGSAETYVYDPNKFTVVGTPTITEYGVASGFSDNNYLKLPSPVPIGGNKWELCARVYAMENVNTDRFQNIFADYTTATQFSVGINRYGTGLAIAARKSDDSIITIGVSDNKFNANAWHNVLLEYSNKTIYAYVDGILQHNISIDLDDKVYNGNQVVGLNPLSQQMQYGFIDLTQFSITVDGEEVFTGAKVGHYVLRR